MTSPPEASLLRRVLSGAFGATRGSADHGTAAGRLFYFRIELRETMPASPGGHPGRSFGAGDELRCGHRYTVQVTARTYGAHGEVGVSIHGGAWMELAYTATGGLAISDSRFRFARDVDRDGFVRTIAVEVSESGTREEGELLLLCTPDGGTGTLVCARIPIATEGFGTPDQVVLAEAQVRNDRPPPGTAVLHLTRESAGHLRLRGGATTPDGSWRSVTAVVDQPPSDLGTLVSWQLEPSKVLGFMRGYSRDGTAPLQAWLSEVLAASAPGALNLLISDHSDLATPWEMLTVADADHHVTWLGAEANVSRWLPVRFYQHARTLGLDAQVSAGGGLAYVAEQGMVGSAHELETVGRLGLIRCGKLDELRARLRQPLTGVGLIYLASHGIFSTSTVPEMLAAGLGVVSVEGAGIAERLTVLDLEDLGWRDDPRPYVFVNACHSARELRLNAFRLSLPATFLSQVAAGYIGTLCEVGSVYAARVADRFLRACAEESGAVPAAFFRELRAEALEGLRGEETADALRDLVFAFSYVVFGDPYARVHLTGAREATPV